MSFCRDVRITRSAAGRANRELGSRLNANDRLNLAPYLSSPRVHGLYTCGPGQARYQLSSIVKSAGIALAGNSHKGSAKLLRVPRRAYESFRFIPSHSIAISAQVPGCRESGNLAARTPSFRFLRFTRLSANSS